jgi:hypothetical protein
MIVAEVADSAIDWTEPTDLSADEFLRGVNAPGGTTISSRHAGGAHILLTEGSVMFLPSNTTAATLRLLLGKPTQKEKAGQVKPPVKAGKE